MRPKPRARKNASVAREPQQINVVFLSADGRTEEMAKRQYVRLCRQLAGEFQLHPTWLSFDLLNQEAIFLASAQMAAEAQLVFFATYCSWPLPPMVSQWIEAWLPEKAGTTAALVALLWKERRQSGFHGTTHRCLGELARTAGLTLFAGEFDSANRDRPRWWCGPVFGTGMTPPWVQPERRCDRNPATTL